MAKNDEVGFLLEDYRQAWDHYRHVEDERLRYLTIYFTATLGSAAIAAPLLAASSLDSGGQLLAVATFLGVFQAFSFFVSVTIRRFGTVLLHYSTVMHENRLRRGKLLGVSDDDAAMIGVGGKVRRPRWMYSPQRVAEVTLAGFLLSGALLAGLTLCIALSWHSPLHIAVCAAELAGALVATGLVFGTYVHAWRHPDTKSDYVPAE